MWVKQDRTSEELPALRCVMASRLYSWKIRGDVTPPPPGQNPRESIPWSNLKMSAIWEPILQNTVQDW